MKKIFILSILLTGYSLLCAQDSIQAHVGVEYITEVQTNFNEQYNWVNLLSLFVELPTEKISKQWKHGNLKMGLSLQTATAEQKPVYSAWVEIEQSLYRIGEREFGVLLYGGRAPLNECNYFYTTGGYIAGLLAKEKRDRLDIYVNVTDVAGIKERTLEITWQYQIHDIIAIQPAFQHIRTGGQITNIGLVRMYLTI